MFVPKQRQAERFAQRACDKGTSVGIFFSCKKGLACNVYETLKP